MALKELQIRNIRPTDKVIQCTDHRGLYLEVHPNGSKLWRYKYRYMGKQKRLALGRYPDVGLADARRRRDNARRQLEAGSDPLAERKHEKLVAVFKAANTFGDIAKEYIDKMVAEGRADTTTTKANWLLEQLEPIAARPVADLKPIDVLASLKRIEAKGKHETARRCRHLLGASSATLWLPGAAKPIRPRSCAARWSFRRSRIMQRSLIRNRWASLVAR